MLSRALGSSIRRINRGAASRLFATVNHDGNAKIEQFWDSFADHYKQNEIGTLQALATCAYVTGAHKAERILEVGCGTGTHSMALSSVYLQPTRGILVSTDFSQAMMNYLKTSYDESEYGQVPGNKYFIDTVTNYSEVAEDGKTLRNLCSIDDLVAEQGQFRKLVLGARANNELLPFPSDWFDSYIANWSLFIVDNPVNMIRESFRVLRPGGAACYTLWGQRQNCVQFTVVEDAIEKYLTEAQRSQMRSGRSNFRMYEDGGLGVKQQLEEAGFSRIKIWEQGMHFIYKSGHEFMELIGSARLNTLAQTYGLDDEVKEKAYADAVELFDLQSGSKTTDLRTNSTAVVVAFKD